MSLSIKDTTVCEWANRIDDLGSSHDPIWYYGMETTPAELVYKFEALNKIRGVKITYFGKKRGKLRKIEGTMGGMMRERARKEPTRRIYTSPIFPVRQYTPKPEPTQEQKLRRGLREAREAVAHILHDHINNREMVLPLRQLHRVSRIMNALKDL